MTTNFINLETWFSQQITTVKPLKTYCELPSNFQIGDNVEIITDKLEKIEGYIFSVTFAANGAVYYDIAVPIANTSHFAVLNKIRGSMQLKGENNTADDLRLIPVEELHLDTPEFKRSQFKVVLNKTEEIPVEKII